MTHPRLLLRVASIALTTALAACVGTVSGGPGPDSVSSTGTNGSGPLTSGEGTGGGPGSLISGGSGGGGGESAGTGGTAPFQDLPVPGAIAITAGQLGMSHCGSSAPCDPATLFLELGVPPPTCADPQPALNVCGSTADYHVSIGIPPDLLQPATLSLSTPALFTYFNVAGGSQGACGGGAGSFSTGDLTLDSIDQASVTFTLAGATSLTPMPVDPGSTDGTYVATRCP